MGTKVYSKEKIEELNLNRDRQVLKPLLMNRIDEEGSGKGVIDFYNNKPFTYNKSFILFSEKQVYKTFSTLILVNNFNRKTKYTVLSFSVLLDYWYSKDESIKRTLMTPEILILHGIPNSQNASFKALAIKELLEARKTFNKLTWLFVEGTSMSEFNSLYDNLSKEFTLTVEYK